MIVLHLIEIFLMVLILHEIAGCRVALRKMLTKIETMKWVRP